MYKNYIKRMLDIMISGTAMVVLALPMLLIAIAVKVDSPGPVLFKQKRVGVHKTHFNMLKFRTMYVDTPSDVPTHLLKDAKPCITKVGRVLRKTSLDELPQLINILKGDMSLIGPRPALWNQYDLIAERDKYGANDIKPGLTGWAQINGRDELEIPVKAKYDGEYTVALAAGKGKGFAMDVRCFLGTIVSVLKSDGVVEGGTGVINKENDQKDEGAFVA